MDKLKLINKCLETFTRQPEDYNYVDCLAFSILVTEFKDHLKDVGLFEAFDTINGILIINQPDNLQEFLQMLKYLHE